MRVFAGNHVLFQAREFVEVMRATLIVLQAIAINNEDRVSQNRGEMDQVIGLIPELGARRDVEVLVNFQVVQQV